MAKNKTTETNENVFDFIESYVTHEQKKADSLQLIQLMTKWSGHQPKMWGPTIIGFGSYHYKYASGREGDVPIIGFSPRKAKFSLYIYTDTDESKKLLSELGKHKMSKACLYVNKLVDINIPILEKLCKETIEYLKKNDDAACGKVSKKSGDK